MFFTEPLKVTPGAIPNALQISAISVPDFTSPFSVLILGISIIAGLIVLTIICAKKAPLIARLIWIVAVGAGLLMEGIGTIGIQAMWITFIAGVAGLYFLGSPPHPGRAG